MNTIVREYCCEYASASEAGDYFQVLFKKAPDCDEEYVLVQRQFEFPDGGKCYVETEDLEFCGHFRVRSANLSRNRFQISFGSGPVRKIVVLFNATDSVCAEVMRVLQILIPEIDLS